MSEYSASFERHGSYSFDAGSIADMCQIAHTFVGKAPEITINLEDSHSIQAKCLKDLLSDLLVKNILIIRITIAAACYKSDPARRIQIALDRRSEEWPIDVQISGARTQAIKARTDIENIIAGRTLWYSLHGIPEKWAAIGTMAAVLTIAALLAWGTLRLLWPTTPNLFSPTTTSDLLFIVAFSVASLLYFLPLGMIWMTRIFPRMAFDIGRSERLGQTASYWRSIIFAVVALGVLANLMSSFIISIMQSP